MSDTPRTDALEHVQCEHCIEEGHKVVPVEFARQLERELNEARQRTVATATTGGNR